MKKVVKVMKAMKRVDFGLKYTHVQAGLTFGIFYDNFTSNQD